MNSGEGEKRDIGCRKKKRNLKNCKVGNNDMGDLRASRGMSKRVLLAREKQQQRLTEKENWSDFASGMASEEERNSVISDRGNVLRRDL